MNNIFYFSSKFYNNVLYSFLNEVLNVYFICSQINLSYVRSDNMIITGKNFGDGIFSC